LTIGDPTVYSTYQYIHKRMVKGGYEAHIVNGVPSFCAAAGTLGISLADNKEEIHVIPASYEIGKTAEFSGTRIYMKSGKKLGELKQMLQKQQKDSRLEVYSVENCGMMNEKITTEVEKLDDTSGYLTIVIVKEH